MKWNTRKHTVCLSLSFTCSIHGNCLLVNWLLECLVCVCVCILPERTSCTGGRGKLKLPETMLSSETLLKWQDKQGQCFHSQSSQLSDTFSRFHLSPIMMPLNTPRLPCLPPSITSLTYCIPTTVAELLLSPTDDCFFPVQSSKIRFIIPFQGTDRYIEKKPPSFNVTATN